MSVNCTHPECKYCFECLRELDMEVEYLEVSDTMFEDTVPMLYEGEDDEET